MPPIRPKVLVTGATGFIGQRCLPLLTAAGYEVHSLRRGAAAPGASTPVVQWHTADLLDGDVGPILSKVRPSHLLHLAWIATPGVFWASPDNLRWLQSTKRLAAAFFRQGGERAVGVGTCAEYEWAPDDLHESGSPLVPDTIYGRCKVDAFHALTAAAADAGKSAAWARLFVPYGPGEPEAKFISAIIGGLLRGRAVPCSDGHQIRDFLFVDDVADALVALLLSNVQGPVNVASGSGRTLREVAARISALSGADPALLRFGERQAPSGDPARVVADVTRLTLEVGWRPRVGLDEGLDITIAHWRRALGVEKEKA